MGEVNYFVICNDGVVFFFVIIRNKNETLQECGMGQNMRWHCHNNYRLYIMWCEWMLFKMTSKTTRHKIRLRFAYLPITRNDWLLDILSKIDFMSQWCVHSGCNGGFRNRISAAIRYILRVCTYIYIVCITI